MKLIVGLGNPGKKYERTRHNLGFMVLDRLACKSGVTIDKSKAQALIGEWKRGGESVLLVKPQTFMNLSGQALATLFRYHPVEAGDVIVVHDDLDLPFGRLRIREQGSAGGNRGMLSVLQALGEVPFVRVRIGIGRPPPGVDPADFVLQRFTPDEKSQLSEIVGRATDAVEAVLDEGPRRTMEKFNRAG
ncbi:MAG TPA: aminoacyl-tRNA hydrolase [Candidatus Binatia bacterium]